MKIEEHYGINRLDEYRPIIQQAMKTVFAMAQNTCTESEHVQELSVALLQEGGFLDFEGKPIKRGGDTI